LIKYNKKQCTGLLKGVAVLVDYHIHVVAHGEYRYEYWWLYRFLQNARAKNIKEVGFSEHDEYASMIDSQIIQKVQNEFQDIKVRLGLEVDYIPGREEKIKEIIASKAFDYVIGSVHFIDGWGFDHPDFKERFDEKDIDDIYEAYFSLVCEAVKSDLFDIVGHIDLIKVWGHRPRRKSTLYYIEPLLKRIKESGMVIEINSSGMRKPVKELYPAKDILQMIKAMNIPITLSSDAHHPDQLGFNYDQVVSILHQIGFKYLTTFNKRKKILMPLRIC